MILGVVVYLGSNYSTIASLISARHVQLSTIGVVYMVVHR